MEPSRPDRRSGDTTRPSPTADPVPGERIGPYEVVREVARGGMATVMEVRDTRDSSTCALKLLLPLANAEEARSRFRREFRALSRLEHPNVLRVYEWGLRGERPWFTMELVEGCDLRTAVGACPHSKHRDHVERAEAVLLQVGRALAYIHDHGLVHRDVTPGNIMLTPSGEAKLMDFGVVKDLSADMTSVGEVIGTVAYISPEQIMGETVDARADLYSLGAVLYFLLTGRRPFTARTLQGYLEKHLHQQPRPVRELDPMVPAHLDEICLRLLAKDPADRYASAHHLLHVLGDVTTSESTRWPPHLVGRTLTKSRIRDAVDSISRKGPGSATLITGEPGLGKTRLLELAETWARRYGLPVARSRCRPNDRPFGAFRAVYQALATDSTSPVLKAAMGEADDGRPRERYPIISAFRDLVVARAPAVIILDDLENADPATLELLEYLIHNTLELDAHPVVFVLAHPLAQSDGSPVHLTLSPTVQRVRLQPLVQAEVEELVLSLLPNNAASRTLAARLHAESDGSPVIITDMLRRLHSDGVLAEDDGRMSLTLPAAEITRSSLPMPASLRHSLARRLAPLDARALDLARYLAVSRRSIELDVLLTAVGGNEDDVMEALDDLIEAGVATESRVNDVEKVDVTRRPLRGMLLESVSDEEQRRLYQVVGEALERHHRQRASEVVEELARHFELAGLAPKAYRYLILTARKHQNSSLFEETLGFLERALRMEPAAREFMLLDEADRQLAEVHLARSRALYSLGRGTEALAAAHEVERLAELVRDPRLQSEVARELGTQLRNQGDLDQAEPYLRRALERAEEAGDRSLLPMPLYQLGGIMWARGNLAQAERLWKNALTTAQRTGDERAQGFGFNGLGILAICKGNSIDARRHLERSAALFEHLGMLAPLSVAWVNLAELYLSTGMLRKAQELSERTVAKAREVQHPHGIAMGLTHRAQVLVELGRFDEALRNAQGALRLARELGVTDDIVQALTTMVQVELVRDRPTNALAYLRELSPLLETHDTEGITPQVVAWHAQALAALGRKREGVQVLHGSQTDERHWPHSRVRADLARGRALRLLDYPEAGRQLLQRALATAEANGYRFYQLLAHQELLQVVEDETTRARHARIARALARSLAANLPTEDSTRFMERGWGYIGE